MRMRGRNAKQHSKEQFPKGQVSLTTSNLGITSPIAHHELPTNDLPLLATDGLAIVVHFQSFDGFGRSHVGIVSMALWRPTSLLRRRVRTFQHVRAAL